MTTREFIELVRRMRTAQKDYFKTRSTDALKLSKNLEMQVDEVLQKAAAAPPKTNQG